MGYVYRPTALESKVSLLYKRLGMYHADEICERTISYELGITLTYTKERSYAYENGNFKLINIDPRLSQEEKRERYYHELCHILRHAGYQLKMPVMFKELQEWDAVNFTRYAAIPFHMLFDFDLKSEHVISTLATAFKVTEEMCQERLEQISRGKVLKVSESNIYYNSKLRGEHS